MTLDAPKAEVADARGRTIVAEISKTWVAGQGVESGLLSQRFEAVIAHNERLGYLLDSWRMMSAVTGGGGALTETIVAVFRLSEPEAGRDVASPK